LEKIWKGNQAKANKITIKQGILVSITLDNMKELLLTILKTERGREQEEEAEVVIEIAGSERASEVTITI